MPTLAELMTKFASASGEEPATHNTAVAGDGHNKLASGGEENMNSLQNIYMSMVGLDKTAAAVAGYPVYETEVQESNEDIDFAKVAEQLADAEAEEQVQSYEEGGDFLKVAAEYDAAGRIMARGFFDEFLKLAEATTAADNQNTESESAAKTTAFGDRSLPTLETNYAGTVDTGTPGRQPQMTGTAPKQVYADSMETSKMINAGVTGDDPEAAALSLGGGAPVGFATVRDLQA